MSDIRLDLLHNKYVLIAPERLHRPDFYQKIPNEEVPKKSCPFCDGSEYMTPPEIFAIRDNTPNSNGWKTRVVPNLYKAVQVELEDHSRRDGMFESTPGVGAHEVIIDSTNHDKDIFSLDVSFTQLWLNTIIARIEDLKKDKRLVHLSVFKNHGHNAGATQEHPHTQLLALPIMPRGELDFLEQNLKYYKRHGRGKLQDILENEKHSKGKRVLAEIGSFIAYCPYASSFPFEVVIAPCKNISTLAKCNRDDIVDLSHILQEVFNKLHKQLGEFDYNLYFRLAPLNSNFENEAYLSSIDKNFRFNIRIIPRIYRFGGFELSTNMAINPTPPEECANLLNQKD